MSEQGYTEAVNTHYGAVDVLGRILAGLRAGGKDPQALELADLAPVDQFHSGGRAATLELAGMAGLTPGTHMLDVGGGIGGAARVLADQFGVSATVLDLTEEFCRTGAALTELLHMSSSVHFVAGSALELPFAAASFDAAWTQHAAMNIADKERLYAEIARVVRPGGRFALHDIMAGPGGEPLFPVPWAADPAISFLRPAEQIRELIASAGFAEISWRDSSADATAWFQERSRQIAAATSAPPLGLHLFLGPQFGPMFGNLGRNFAEGRVTAVQAVFERR